MAGNAALDVVSTWEMALIALFAPFFVWAVYEWLRRNEIDETKIIPLGLGAGIYGALVVGFVAWGDKTGGYLGSRRERTPSRAPRSTLSGSSSASG